MPENPAEKQTLIEKRTRLPIILLLASGYFLGVMLPIPAWLGPSWLKRVGYWGVVLPVAFLFYNGRDRLLALIREVDYGDHLELARVDRWYDKLVRFVSFAAAICMCALLGLGAGHFARGLGLNWYISGAVGVLIFWGIVAFIVDHV